MLRGKLTLFFGKRLGVLEPSLKRRKR